MEVREININDIEVTENVRMGKSDKEIASLMSSIHQDGLKQPIGVVSNNGKYRLIYGFRRLTAYKKLGMKLIPAVIGTEEDLKDQLIINVVENIQRVNILPAELGIVCLKLQKLGLTDKEIAARLGIPYQRVNNSKDIASRIPERLRDRIIFCEAGGKNVEGAISSQLAKEALKIAKEEGLTKEKIGELIEIAHQKNLYAREMRAIAGMVRQGMSVKEAVSKIIKYTIVRVDVVLENNELEEKKERLGMNMQEVLKAIIYGKVDAFKKPDFVTIKIKKG